MEGKFFVHRKIFESDIWGKPAYYLKIWLWVIGKANWKTVKRGGKTFNRGEFITNYEDIIKENEWRVGWSIKRLAKDQVFNVLDFLRKTQRIGTRKATRGLWIKVLNYDYFQRLSKDETTNEGNGESNSPSTDDQQGKRKKNEIIMKEDNPLSFKDKIEAYKRGRKDYKPYYRGYEMRWSQNKWWVIEDGEWKEFADPEDKIEWK